MRRRRAVVGRKPEKEVKEGARSIGGALELLFDEALVVSDLSMAVLVATMVAARLAG